jgi:hypothetical protein
MNEIPEWMAGYKNRVSQEEQDKTLIRAEGLKKAYESIAKAAKDWAPLQEEILQRISQWDNLEITNIFSSIARLYGDRLSNPTDVCQVVRVSLAENGDTIKLIQKDITYPREGATKRYAWEANIYDKYGLRSKGQDNFPYGYSEISSDDSLTKEISTTLAVHLGNFTITPENVTSFNIRRTIGCEYSGDSQWGTSGGFSEKGELIMTESAIKADCYGIEIPINKSTQAIDIKKWLDNFFLQKELAKSS